MNDDRSAAGTSVPEFGPAYGPQDLTAFRTLNEEWITRYFTLEDTDRQQLGDPEGQILAPGGRIFMARLHGEAVGCVACGPPGPASTRSPSPTAHREAETAKAHRG